MPVGGEEVRGGRVLVEREGSDAAALPGDSGQEGSFVPIAAVYGMCVSVISIGDDGGRVPDIDGTVVHSSGDESHIVPIRNCTGSGRPRDAGEAAGGFYTFDNFGGLACILRCDPKIKYFQSASSVVKADYS